MPSTGIPAPEILPDAVDGESNLPVTSAIMKYSGLANFLGFPAGVAPTGLFTSPPAPPRVVKRTRKVLRTKKPQQQQTQKQQKKQQRVHSLSPEEAEEDASGADEYDEEEYEVLEYPTPTLADTGRGADLPLSVQIAADHWNEHLILQAMQEIEDFVLRQPGTGGRYPVRRPAVAIDSPLDA